MPFDVFAVASYRLTAAAIPSFVTACAVAYLIARSLRLSRGGRATLPFVGMLLPLFIWFSTLTFVLLSRTEAVAFVWAKAGYLGIPFIPASIYQFGAAYAGKKRSWTARILWGISILLTAFVITSPSVIAGLHRYQWGYYPRYGALGAVFVGGFLSLVAAVLALFVLRRDSWHRSDRQTFTSFLKGFGVLSLSAIDFLPCFGIGMYPIGFIAVLGYLLFLWRAIDAHGLIDVTVEAASSRILETVSDGVIACDAQGRIQVVNRAATEMLGYPIEQLIGHRIDVLDHPESTFGRYQSFAYLLSRAPVRNLDRVIHRADGSLMEVSVSVSRLGSDSTHSGAVLTLSDATERKRGERAVRDSEERFRRLFERNVAGVYRATFDGLILECNDAFAVICGARSASELAGRSTSELYGSEQRSHVMNLIREVRNLPTVEYELTRFDGAKIEVIEGLSHVVEQDGEYVQGTVIDISDQKRAQEQIAFYGTHDSLTLLPNRHSFTDDLNDLLLELRSNKASAAVICMDLDQFKVINDTLGHTAGDELIILAAERLRTACGTAALARVGGDQFTAVIPGITDVRSAHAWAQEILKTISEPLRLGDHVLYVTMSIGIALFPADGDDADALLKRADAALSSAKNRGRGSIEFASVELDKQALQRFEMEKSLFRALEEDQFRVYFQPIFDLERSAITAAEALLRWDHPQLGLLTPNRFMTALEESPLIIRVGEIVMREACEQARRWRDQGLDLRVSVNVSPRQLYSATFTDTVRNTVLRAGIEPERLELEITESVAANDSSATIAVLARIREFGVRIAIDDFGTGYSSLNYLQRFPITTLKIDQAFIRDLMRSEDRNWALIRAMIAMARSLGLDVIAEGVETKDQLAFLRGEGCNFVQGYLFGRPQPAEAMIQTCAAYLTPSRRSRPWQLPV